MERLAIMGGTFDPIHMGHLRMARAVQRQMDFDRVVFLPSYIPPHKQTRSNCASWQDRLAMVELAIQEYDDFVVSCLEFDLIIGEDALIHLYKWYRMQDLLRLVHFVAAKRSGYEGAAGVAQLVRAYGPWAAEKVIHAEVPETTISSTEIRQRLREGKPIRGMVSLAVEKYIYERGLYGAES